MLRHAIVFAAFTACATSALADPTTVSFEVDGAYITAPVSINSAGDVTGLWTGFDMVPHGFIRFQNGEILKFEATSKSNWQTDPVKINDRGDVAGTLYDAGTKISRGFVRSVEGRIKTFDVPGTLPIVITGFNNDGAVMGYRYDENNHVMNAFERKPGGKVQLLEISGATSIAPGAITDKGVIVGAYSVSGLSHGFIRKRNGAVTTIDPPQDSIGSIVALNTAGTMAGDIYGPGNFASGGFVRTNDGTVTTFDVEGKKNVVVSGMNESGTVTGYFGPHGGNGFVRAADGTITSFGYGARHSTYPRAINNSGAITGIYISFPSSGARAGFVRTP